MTKTRIKARTIFILALGLVAATAYAVSATTSSAMPTYSSACSLCHVANANVLVSVNAIYKGVTGTTYSFNISGPFSGGIGYGVFDSSGTRVAGGDASSGTFVLANGGSYRFYGVNKDPGSMNGYGTVTLNPTASVAAPTATPVPPSATVWPATTPKETAWDENVRDQGEDKGPAVDEKGPDKGPKDERKPTGVHEHQNRGRAHPGHGNPAKEIKAQDGQD